jgi:hypothetical protein
MSSLKKNYIVSSYHFKKYYTKYYSNSIIYYMMEYKEDNKYNS